MPVYQSQCRDIHVHIEVITLRLNINRNKRLSEMNKMLSCADSQVLACSRLACGEYMQTSTGYNTELPMWCSYVVVVWDY
jgi:hypothetical protein